MTNSGYCITVAKFQDNGSPGVDIIDTDEQIKEAIIEDIRSSIENGDITTHNNIKDYVAIFMDNLEDEYEFEASKYLSDKDFFQLHSYFNELSLLDDIDSMIDL